jgi:hypothetical protein
MNTGIVPPNLASAVPGATVPVDAPTYGPPGTQVVVPPPPTPGPVTAPPPPIPPSSQPSTSGTVNGVDPVHITPTAMGGYQPFIDSAYQQAASRLDPQFHQAEDQFRQQMVNQGIPEGSQAFNDAYGNFTRAKNDAYDQARASAFSQGLAAQGQGFNQGQAQAALAQAMAQWNDQRNLQQQGITNQANQFGQTLGQHQYEYGTDFNENQRQFNDQYSLGRDQFDMNSMLGLSAQDQNAFALNQNAAYQNFQMSQALLGMVPAAAPTQIDTYSPYNMQQQSINAQNANAASQSNGLWGAVGSLGAAAIPLISSRELKSVGEPVNVDNVLSAVRSLPVDRWTYNGDVVVHVGTYAEDFNAALGLDPKPYIHQVDLFGALMASIQSLAEKVEKLEKGNG